MSSAIASSIQPNGNCTDRAFVARFATAFGLELLSDSDIARVRAIGADLIGQELATAEKLIECQRAAEAVVFGFRECGALTGMLALLPLNERGHHALANAKFDAREPALDLVARPGQAPACYYAWGIAALSKNSSRALIQASSAMRTQIFWAIPTYARAATGEGLRLMSSFGYRPYSSADPTLIMAPAAGAPKAAAS